MVIAQNESREGLHCQFLRLLGQFLEVVEVSVEIQEFPQTVKTCCGSIVEVLFELIQGQDHIFVGIVLLNDIQSCFLLNRVSRKIVIEFVEALR